MTREASEPTSRKDELLAIYDANNDDEIDLTEVNDAIDDFFKAADDPDKISLEDVNIVIDLFFETMT